MKEINFTPRNKLKIGLDKIADSVKITIGPKGRNVVIDRGIEPLITNDGGTIAQDIQLKDKVENMGAQIIKGVIRKISENVGGGRTASAILTQAIVNEGLKRLENGMNIQLLRKGMQEAVADITENLKKNSRKVTTKEEITQIATISTESSELGEVISEVIDKVGKDCIVTIEDSQTFGITSEITEGMKFDKGFISPYMITNPDRMEALFTDIPVLITDKKISIFNELIPVIKKLTAGGRNSLFIVCEDLDGDALNNSVLMKIKGQFNLLAVKAPGYADKSTWLEDLAVATGTKVVSSSNGIGFDVKLGEAKKVISTKDSTVIVAGNPEFKTYTEDLKKLLENSGSKFDQERLKQRIAIISGKVAVIKVGAATESEAKYLKTKIEDGVNEAKRALEEGIVVGGDVAFINAAKTLKIRSGDELAIGYNIVLRSVELPFKQIIKNSRGKSSKISLFSIFRMIANWFYIRKVTRKVKKSSSQIVGYNALTNEIVTDMFEEGIIDALKVTRTVLENAVSGASMFLSIEVAISDEIEDKPKAIPEY